LRTEGYAALVAPCDPGASALSLVSTPLSQGTSPAGVGDLWRELRSDFPALDRYVYLNAAAAGPIPRPVQEAAQGFYREIAEHGDGPWDGWLQRAEEIRARAAAFVNADPDEIAFVPNASTGINLVIDLLAGEGAVLTDEIEFPAVTLPWIHRGVAVHFQPAADGIVTPESFDERTAPEAATLAISHVQFSNGCRQDLDAFGAVKGGRRLVVAGSQAAGAFAVDVQRSRVDAYVAGGHKWLCAGYGTGFAFIRRELIARHPPRAIGWLSVEDPFLFDNRRYRLLASNRRTEQGCPAFGAIFALGAALRYLTEIGVDRIEARVLALNAQLTERLDGAGFKVLSPGGAHRSGQTLCVVEEPSRAVSFLAERRILVTEKPRGVRISTHFFNDEKDIEAVVTALSAYRGGGRA
jgi:cysteine desulfurase/selenocysteine lyase